MSEYRTGINGMEDLASQLVTHLKQSIARNYITAGGVYIAPLNTDDYDYLYIIKPILSKNTSKQFPLVKDLKITVYENLGNQKKPIFKGNIKQYLQKYIKQKQKTRAKRRTTIKT